MIIYQFVVYDLSSLIQKQLRVHFSLTIGFPSFTITSAPNTLPTEETY